VAKLRDSADDDSLLASINIIPFVDIVLVLLVIFMLTSAAIVKASLKVELPKAATGGARVETTLSFLRTKSGELFLNGEKLASIADAARVVRREATANPKVQAVISADKGVEYGQVIEIIDTVKHNGVSTFALDIERGPAPPDGTTPPGSPAAAPAPSPAAVPVAPPP
jgi:biopolymer transport protein ExbD